MTSVRITGLDKTEAGFKEARRDIDRRNREGIKRAGEQAILPAVRGRSPSIVVPWLTIRATAKRGYITVQGPRIRDRITGLLNFGGRVEAPILPKKKKALRFRGTQDVRFSVTTPRVYRGKHFIEEGVDAGAPQFKSILLHEVMKSYSGLPHEEV